MNCKISLLLMGLVFILGCNNLEAVHKKMSIKFDPQLSISEKEMIRNDILALIGYQIHADSGSYYDKAFSGTDSTAALHFLDERINYIIPESADLMSRVRLGPIPLPIQDEKPAEDTRALLMAVNVGTAMYYAEMANPLPFLHFKLKIGNKKIRVSSPRVGIIQLGKGYTMEKSPRGTLITPVIRTSTLIHEARHSDCTGGIMDEDIKLVQKGKPPQNPNCGHTHIACPENHELSGIPACDGHAWGAYAIGMLYDGAIGTSCKNCSELEKQQGFISALESLGRIIPASDMLSGKLGDPDMSNSDRKKDGVLRFFMREVKKSRSSGNQQSLEVIQEEAHEFGDPVSEQQQDEMMHLQ